LSYLKEFYHSDLNKKSICYQVKSQHQKQKININVYNTIEAATLKRFTCLLHRLIIRRYNRQENIGVFNVKTRFLSSNYLLIFIISDGNYRLYFGLVWLERPAENVCSCVLLWFLGACYKFLMSGSRVRSSRGFD
jgi:hypothetical protein